MGLSKEKLVVGPVRVPLTYRCKDGSTANLSFLCRRESIYEHYNNEATQLLTAQASDPVLRLSRVILEPPTGIDDFPSEGPLEDRFVSYFQGNGDAEESAELHKICTEIWQYYRLEVAPLYLFRSVQNSGEQSGVADAEAVG